MNLRQQTVTGMKFSALISVMKVILPIITYSFLLRFLDADEFGLVAMVFSFTGIVNIFQDSGLSSAVIHFQDTGKKELSTIFSFNVLFGILLAVGTFFSAPLVASFYNESELTHLIQIITISFIFFSVSQLHLTLLKKNLHFNVIARIEVIGNLSNSTMAVILAYHDFGALSLVYGNLTYAIVKTILLLLNKQEQFSMKLDFNFREIKKYFVFGYYHVGEKLINFFNSNVDQILIGKMLGKASLGYYSIAMQLVAQPLQKINPMINQVIFPVFSKIQNENEKLKNAYYEMLRYLSLINFPLLLGLAAVAFPFMEVYSGSGWEQSAVIIQILAVNALVVVVNNPVGSLQLAKGRPELGFYWNLAVAFLMPVSIFFAAKFDLVTVAVVRLGLYYILYIFMYLFLIKPLIGKSLKQYFIDSFALPFLAAGFMAGIVYLVINMIYLPEVYELATGVITGIFVYAILIFVFYKKDVSSLYKMFFKK